MRHLIVAAFCATNQGPATIAVFLAGDAFTRSK